MELIFVQKLIQHKTVFQKFSVIFTKKTNRIINIKMLPKNSMMEGGAVVILWLKKTICLCWLWNKVKAFVKVPSCVCIIHTERVVWGPLVYRMCRNSSFLPVIVGHRHCCCLPKALYGKFA